MKPTLALALAICLGVIALHATCAPSIQHEPTAALQPAQHSSQLGIVQGLDVNLWTGFTTHIKPQTIWSLVGTLLQGDVYKSRDQVLTVEGADMHEAYLVVSGDELVGFCLPVEHAFVHISPARRSVGR